MSRQNGLVWYKNPFRWLTETGIGILVLGGVTLPLLSLLIYSNADANQATWWIGVKLLAPFAVVAWGLYSQVGGPRNWWVPFFGILMKVSLAKIAQREQKGEHSDVIQSEIHEWVKGMATGAWYRRNGLTYQFLRKSDAAMFKLAWG